MSVCVICRYGQPIHKYNLGALIINRDMFYMCDQHKKEAEERIKSLRAEQPKTVILDKSPKMFVPNQVRVKPNFQDREPGQEG